MAEEQVLSFFYYKLAERYLGVLYSLERLDQRFEECDAGFIPRPGREERLFAFLSLVNRAHIERLDPQELEQLNRIYEGKEPEEDTVRFLEKTCARVLAGHPDSTADYEYFPDLYRRGIFPANAVVFLFRDRTGFIREGQIDVEAERRKNRVFASVKRQFEELANRNGGMPVYLTRT